MPSRIAEPFQKLGRKLRRAILRDEPTYFDMFERKGERYFARLYLQAIENHLAAESLEGNPVSLEGGLAPLERGYASLRGPLRILDAGCQAGRLSIPLAQKGHRVTGVDTSDLALRRLRRHAKENGTQVQTVRANLTQWLPRQPKQSFDAVVCTEVLYMRSNYRTLLEGLIRLIRPGGICFISHRPPEFYLAEALGRRDEQTARRVLQTHEGQLWGSYYNWQTAKELETLYGTLGVQLLGITSIGIFSWLGTNPEELGPRETELFFEADRVAGPRMKTGRYLLVSAKVR